MKKKILCLFIALLLVGCSSGNKGSSKPEVIDFDFDGNHYVLPGKVSDFTGNGWTYCSDNDDLEEDIQLGSNQYTKVYYCKGDYYFELAIVNTGSGIATTKDATVVEFRFSVPYRRGDMSDDFIVVKGANLATSADDIKKLWKDFPNLNSDSYSISYHISGVDAYSHDGAVELYIYDGKMDMVTISSTDIYDYERFRSDATIRRWTDGDKEEAVSITAGYNIATTLNYTMGYVKGTIISEVVIYQESDSYINKDNGYLLKDELGQLVAIIPYYGEEVVFEIGQEYEIWGILETNCYTDDVKPIVAVMIYYVEKDDIEVFNHYYVTW